MKRAVLFFIVGLIPTGLFAQVLLLDKASDFIQAKEYEQAQQYLLKAEMHPSTANDPRTHYLKAFLFKELYQRSSDSEKANYLNKALVSLKKCNKADLDKTYAKSTEELELFFGATIFNQGSDLFNKKKYQECILEFKKYLQVAASKTHYWLEANYYTATAFFELGKLDSAKQIFKLLLNEKYDQPLLYADLSTIYQSENDWENASALLQQAIARYSQNYDLKVAQINVYLHFEKYKELEPIVESFLSQYPSAIEVMLLAGTVYEHNSTEETKIEYRKKMEQVYSTILTMDSLNYDANYNLGVLYYNQAVDIINQSDLEISLDELTFALEKSTFLFEKALPFLHRILTYDQVNVKLFTALQAIYYNLNMKTELAKISTLLSEVKQ